MKNSKLRNNKAILILISHLWFLTLCLCVSALNITAQTGGTFDLSHTVVASGGGSGPSAQAFVVDGTVGQNLAGTVSTGLGNGGELFGVRGGFWAFEALAPTAASVPVAGRVMKADGTPIANVRVNLIGPNSIRTAISNGFGYYRIDEVAIGQTYILEARHKQHAFNVRSINVTDEIFDLDLIALS